MEAAKDTKAEKETKAAKKANRQAQAGSKPKADPKQKAESKQKSDEPKLIGITCKKSEDFSDWYQQSLIKGEMIEYTDIPGCFIYLPKSYGIWERIQRFFNDHIEKLGVENVYFPLFISEANLQREKDHIEGFAAEVAWVDRGGKTKLDPPVAIRPTSETTISDYYSKKVRSHRDLPIRFNQWAPVVRWEFKHAVPFLRTREFLWQEGHTVHQSKEMADQEVRQILDIYAAIYEELLAVPMVKGRKTVNEQFPGALYTTTVEGFIPEVGRGIQGATSHGLGQHFAKMFEIAYEDPDQQVKEGERRQKLYAWQNSWGFTTRSIGVMAMIHGDDKGLFLPPRVANVQVILVPVGITAKTTEESRKKLYDEVDGLCSTLKEAGVRVRCDDREDKSPGFKFAEHELRGVPLRLEYGPKDAEKGVVTFSRRDQSLIDGGKGTIPVADIAKEVPLLLEQIQADMFKRASEDYASHRKVVRDWNHFVPELNAKHVLLVPHCLGGDCEDEIKKDSSAQNADPSEKVDPRAPSMGAKSLCIPDEQPEPLKEGTKCIHPRCQKNAEKWVLFGRSY
ncbi:prolyl-tRNA synthetase [Piedraia hortae CBS 480.64]|uniref:Proline--tRNA ligase n=1 Tax=Piedraia hortae CBS 480.64 TaxID=1314780 RepID=A0A6A7C4B8_9PEZI|nr:prolyl-tRNA synthetase [Piedraia hortae CBS 480.64]